MCRVFIFLMTLFTLLLSVDEVHALRMHRCSGKIQYRPCPAGVTSLATRGRSISAPNYARVISSEFSELPKHEGIWRGAVAGNGTVHLRLFIKKNGVVQSSRYMGNIDLDDHSTTFAFRSVTPKGKDWSWDIVAYNG